MRTAIIGMTAVGLLALGAGGARAGTCPDGHDPRQAVESYTRAMKENRFEDAYDALTAAMTDAAPRDQWAANQRRLFDVGQVQIGDLDVRTAHAASPDEPGCDTRAIVPNVLRAADRFNNQGSTEFEIYTVVKTGDGWRIESQETLIEETDIRKWFPDDEIPTFKDQL